MSSGAPIKGRGATFNPANRYRRDAREPYDDGWNTASDEEADAPVRPRTIVTIQPARTILAHNDSPDVPFNTSLNAYQGCEHGCIYCFARPTHAYHDLSPGIDFETKILAKPNAAELGRRHSGGRDGRAGDPAAQRPRSRGDPRSRGSARRHHGGLGHAAAAAGSRAAVS